MYQILRGMDWMHKNGIWHRDLKPQNLLLMKNGSIKVTDFGLAKGGPFQWVKLSTAVFTLWYRAPEILIQQLLDQHYGRYGAEADVWSIGMVFWDFFMESGELDNKGQLGPKRDFFRGDDDELQLWKYMRTFNPDGLFEEKFKTSTDSFCRKMYRRELEKGDKANEKMAAA